MGRMELEVKVLNINEKDMIQKIEYLGGKFVEKSNYFDLNAVASFINSSACLYAKSLFSPVPIKRVISLILSLPSSKLTCV